MSKALLLSVMINKIADFKKVEEPINHDKLVPLYKDRVMTLSHDPETNKLLLSSTWWGTVKDSHFTLGGHFGKTKEVLHGEIEVSSLKQWHKNHVQQTDIFKNNQITFPE